MGSDLFKQLIEDAENKELQVRVAATVASDAAIYIVERIDAASKGASQAFTDLMLPYLQCFKFFAGIREELDRRCLARSQTVPYDTEINSALPNVQMFGAIAADLEGPRLKVHRNSLASAGERQRASGSDRLHAALHVAELVAASQSGTHPIGHILGPLVGLVIGVLEQKELTDPQDAFQTTSQLLSQLEDIQEQMRDIAVGVYRIPDFWPTIRNLNLQRERRKQEKARCLDSRSPLSKDEADQALTAALDLYRQKNIT